MRMLMKGGNAKVGLGGVLWLIFRKECCAKVIVQEGVQRHDLQEQMPGVSRDQHYLQCRTLCL